MTEKPSRGEAIAGALLDIGAVTLRPAAPFTWASGLKSPIYCDNRLILGYPDIRQQTTAGFVECLRINRLQPDVIAGTATAGIPHAAWLAHELQLPMIYCPLETERARTRQSDRRAARTRADSGGYRGLGFYRKVVDCCGRSATKGRARGTGCGSHFFVRIRNCRPGFRSSWSTVFCANELRNSHPNSRQARHPRSYRSGLARSLAYRSGELVDRLIGLLVNFSS